MRAMITEYFKREDYCWCGDLSAWPKFNEDEYHMFVGPTEDETRRYACGPIPVDVTLPEGEHDKNMQPHLNHISKTGEILSECGVNALFEVVCNDFEEAITKIKYY